MRFCVELPDYDSEEGDGFFFRGSFECESPVSKRPGFTAMLAGLEQEHLASIDCGSGPDSDEIIVSDLPKTDPAVARLILVAIRDRFQPGAELTIDEPTVEIATSDQFTSDL